MANKPMTRARAAEVNRAGKITEILNTLRPKHRRKALLQLEGKTNAEIAKLHSKATK